MNPKPAWQTTEFWIMVVTNVLTVLVLLGLVSAADRATLEGSLVKIAESVGVLAGNALVVWKYISSRTALKVEAEKTKQEVAKAVALAAPDKVGSILAAVNNQILVETERPA